MSARTTKYFIVRRNGGSDSSGSHSPSSSTSSKSWSQAQTPKYEGPPRLCPYATHSQEGGRVAVQKILNRDNLLKTKRGNFELVSSAAWGQILVPVEDPDALDISTQDIESAKLIDNFPKIPSELWARWTSLAFFFCFGDKKETAKAETQATSAVQETSSQTPDRADSSASYLEEAPAVKTPVPTSNISQYEALRFTKLNNLFYKHGYKDKKWELLETLTAEQLAAPTGDVKGSHGYEGFGDFSGFGSQTPELEVSCVLIRKVDDLTQWRILVPKQNVSKGSVNASFDKLVDIETGEEINQFPPLGWAHAGSSHSHNSMQAFFSSTDDASELGVPGLHIVIGNLLSYDSSYKAKASIVLRHNRRIVDIKDVVDTASNSAKFHENVLKMINTDSPAASKPTTQVESKSPSTETSLASGKEPTKLDKIFGHHHVGDPAEEPSAVENELNKQISEMWGEGGGL